MHLRIIVADDHPIVRIGARALIEKAGVGYIIAEASSPDELFSVLENHECDVLVTDFAMPGGAQPDGFVMIRTIRRRYPSLPILMLSMASNIGVLRTVMSLGVRGLIDKGSSLEELPQALRTVHRGLQYLSSGLRERISEMGEAASTGAGKGPTPREIEVLRLLASGMSITEISIQLNRSKTTISRQKGDAMKKIGASNDAELFAFLRNEGY